MTAQPDDDDEPDEEADLYAAIALTPREGRGVDLCRQCRRPTSLGLEPHPPCYVKGRRIAAGIR